LTWWPTWPADQPAHLASVRLQAAQSAPVLYDYYVLINICTATCIWLCLTAINKEIWWWWWWWWWWKSVWKRGCLLPGSATAWFEGKRLERGQEV